MISNEARLLLDYLEAQLYDVKTNQDIPTSLANDEGFLQLDKTIKIIRASVVELGNGNLSYQINGKGYVLGSLKSLQASLRNLTWKTKAIAAGDFSQSVHCLGDFSDSFNSMTKKLEVSIHEIKEIQEHFKMIFDTIPDMTIISNIEDGTVIAYNQAFLETMKFTKEELENKTILITDYCNDLGEHAKFIERLKKDSFIKNAEMNFHGKSDQIITGLVSSRIIKIKGAPHTLSVIRDITELKAIEKKLRESEELHRLLADNAADVIWTMGLDGKFTYVSPSVEKLRGYTVAEVLAQSPEEVLCPSSLIHLQKGLENAIRLIQNNLPFKVFRGELEQPCKNGTTVWTEATVSGIYSEDGRFIGMLGVTRDISDRKIMEEEIVRLSVTDKLTQSYNRLKLDETMDEQLKLAKIATVPFSILILDIDHFKRVNDNYGHQVGDRVLVELVAILQKHVRSDDVVGRWGGEEFLIILPNTDLEGGVGLAEKLQKLVGANIFTRAGRVTISIGVAAYQGDLSQESIVSRADSALYLAKKNGRNRVEYLK
ncbi:diguanylate cyclase [Acetobacterium paludosum]|uniref:Diguanylate cyclase n=1 Tax=Acetobacterium paludosum TaxID=52693 RepID=A0A923HXR0_9FIRM|nr:diguanylate cyclase [Acetobacterium paludosum]MBC3889532.1 diguanylate cyclase [Acetobacterium paludosum]